MTRIPQYARGYRDGARDVVSALHAGADRCAHFGATASLNSYAHGVGAQAARLHECLRGIPGRHQAIAGRVRRPIDPEGLRLARGPDEEERLHADVERLAAGPPRATRHADPTGYVLGYLEAIEFWSDTVLRYGHARNDPGARAEYIPFAEDLCARVAALRAALRPSPAFGAPGGSGVIAPATSARQPMDRTAPPSDRNPLAIG